MKAEYKLVILLALSFCIVTSCSKKVSNSILNAEDQMNEHRIRYKQGFLKDQRAPLKTENETALMDFFDFNQDYNVNCKIVKEENPQPFDMPTYSGTSKVYLKYGVAQCPLKEKTISVALYKSAMAFQNPLYQDHLFLPFKDGTNGDATYGGGRYIDLNVHDIVNDTIRIDFNKSYNPWCAYSDGYSCPVPPAENNLKLNITAGEKKYRGEVKKKK